MSAALPRLVCAVVALLCGLTACTAHDQTPRNAPTSSVVEQSSIRYVSPSGKNSWPGTETKPWRTLGRALPALYAGQELLIRGGTYREQLSKLNLHQGTAIDRIVVRNYPGERVVVRGLVWMRQPSYWTIRGLNVTWDPNIRPVPRAMVKVTGGVHWIWRDSEIWGSHAASNMLIAGYGADEPAHWSVFGNCIHGLQPPASATRNSNLVIGDMGPAGPGWIKRNLIFNDVGQQNLALGTAAGGPTDVNVKFNTIYGGDVAISFAGDTSGVHVSRNILGGVSSDVLIRWHSPSGVDDLVHQNLAVQAPRFFRWNVSKYLTIDGPGNLLSEDIVFADISTCHGFRTTAGEAAPYGRYAVG
jgi:hypothetical protein